MRQRIIIPRGARVSQDFCSFQWPGPYEVETEFEAEIYSDCVRCVPLSYALRGHSFDGSAAIYIHQPT
jgi:hypothetical protein